MMKILIDLNSIKESHNSGSTLTEIKTFWECTYESNFEFPKELVKEGEDYSMTEGTSAFDGQGEPKIIKRFGYIHNIQAMNKINDWILQNKSGGMNIVITQNTNGVSFEHPALEKYDYEYDENTLLNCIHCSKEFKAESVIILNLVSEDGDEYECVACPHCRADVGGHYVYETIEEALIRKQSLG